MTELFTKIAGTVTESYYTEASALGWPPGHWPRTMKAEHLGNGKDFCLERHDHDRCIYRQVGSHVRVAVFND